MPETSQTGLTSRFEIRSLASAPAGWFACYINELDLENLEQSKIAMLPVIGWALVDLPGEEDLAGDLIVQQQIRPFVVHHNGDVLPFDHVDRTFVCIAAPGQDPERTALSVLASDSTKIVFQTEGLPS